MKYRLERLVDGEWCYWGTYDHIADLAEMVWTFGKLKIEVRVLEESE